MDFQEADRQYADLRRRYDNGDLSAEEFRAQHQQITVRDADGRLWAKHRDTGQWHYYDGSTWVQGTPPQLYETTPAPERPPTHEQASAQDQPTTVQEQPLNNQAEQLHPERVQAEDSSDAQPLPMLPLLAQNWRALAWRGLVIVIFGLVVFLPGTFRLAGTLMLMADGVFAIIDATKSPGRKQPLLIQGIIGGSAGLLTGLVYVMGVSRVPAYLVGSWAIFIGIIRITAAIRLRSELNMQFRWEFKMVRLLVMSSVSLLVFGILVAWPSPYPQWPPWALISILALASGITLMIFAFRARSRERSVAAVAAG